MRVQPGQSDLQKLSNRVREGKKWDELFPGVASINLTAEGHGTAIDLRISKKEGIPIHLVPEGTPDTAVVAIKRVDDLGFYNLGRNQLATHIGLTGPKTTAMIHYLKLQDDPECFKGFTIGNTKFKRYSQKAITEIKNALNETEIDEVWKNIDPNVKGTRHTRLAR